MSANAETTFDKVLAVEPVSDGDAGYDAIRAQLNRILASEQFNASERNRKFLAYVVEEVQHGRGDRIKAYSIATSVFGRGADFDPQTDSIVRIEAGRLRRSLERYYLTGGRDDPTLISIPLGSYVPIFEPAGLVHEDLKDAPHNRPRSPSAPGRREQAILVQPFDDEVAIPALPLFGRGFTRQLIIGLTRFTDLRVFSSDGSPSSRASFADAAHSEPQDVDFLLTGSTTLSADRFRIDALLRDARTGRYLWGDSFDRQLSPAEIIAVRDEVADRIVRTLAQPYGVMFSAKAQDTDGLPPDNMSSYQCVIQFYQYWRHFDATRFDGVRKCLERTILRDPGYAAAHACLSLMYTNAFRFGMPVAGGDTRPRAIALARRAVDLAPHSSQSHHALAQAHWFSGNVEAGLASLEDGLALNVNDTDLMGNLGLRYAMRAAWDQGVSLIERSYARCPAQPGIYRTGLALYHLAHGRFEQALAEARRIAAPGVVHGLALIAVAAAELGLRAESDSAVTAILAIDPRYGDHVAADLAARNLHPDLIAMMINGLHKAALPGRETGSMRVQHSA